MSTEYGLIGTKSSVKSEKGNLSFDGVGIDSWDFETAGKALKAMQSWNKSAADPNWRGTENSRADLKKVQAQYNVLATAARYEELLGALTESMAAAAAAAAKSEPAQEALKTAQEQASNASSETGRKQQLRSGLLSLYNRYGSSGGTSSLLSNKATVLGG